VIRGLFRAAVKAVTCREENPQPKPRRRRGETDKGFVATCRAMMRRAAKTGAAVARGRYAGLQEAQEAIAPEPITTADAYASARLYLSDTLDWLNLWQDNADNDHWHDDEFSAKQDQNFLQP